MGELLVEESLKSRIVAPDGRNYHRVMEEFDNAWGTYVRQIFCDHEFQRGQCRYCKLKASGLQL